MAYHAILTFDYTGNHDNAARQRLMKALEALGWEYVPTSSMIVDSESIEPVVHAFEVLARAVDRPGDLSMLALQLELVGAPRTAPGATKPTNALAAVRRMLSPEI